MASPALRGRVNSCVGLAFSSDDEVGPSAPRAINHEKATIPESLKAKVVNPSAFEEIPIIDISADPRVVVEQLRYACEDVGFMQITGHGIPEELIAEHERLHRRFFRLSHDIKNRIHLSDENPVRGYFGKGGEDLEGLLSKDVDAAGNTKIVSQRKDHKEALDMNGVPWSKPTGGTVASMFGMPSHMPEEEELPGFADVMERYSDEMFKLAKRLLTFMALVLGQDEELFEQHLTNPVATHRLLHYWPMTDFQKQIGVGEHTDYGLLTILKQDAVGGLQVLNAKDMCWVHATPIEGALVVNIGDMLARWTGNRFKSTVHRVVNTSNTHRYSVPFFLEPNMESVITPGGLCGEVAHADGSALPCKTAEDILENFYRASGQLKTRGQ
jgi:isopenicillin N synthase-like dioxygenase